MPKVTPSILRWARETAGLTLEDAAKKLQLNEAKGVSAIDRLTELEQGEREPTKQLLSKMAKHYRRPLLVFYMPAPPQKGDRGEDFRTLSDEYSIASNALLDALIRDIQTRQSILRAVLQDEEEVKPLPFVASMKMSDGVSAVQASISQAVQIDLDDFRYKSSPSEAFALLRAKIEGIGVFVLLASNLGSHHSTIPVEMFRGFALADNIAPFIIINDQDSPAAWSFTLIHELAHIWLGQTGISGSSSEKKIERFCNDIASEFLLPSKELRQLDVNDDMALNDVMARINSFAKERNLSSSMVAYKLFRQGVISQNKWLRLSKVFRTHWNQSKSEQRVKSKNAAGGPNYFIVRRHRIGNALIDVVKRMMLEGALTTTKAGQVLGVKAKNVQTLINTGRSIGINPSS
jgi:Zn-dependent peptidase ImmA (M78 family)/transcriptional regulator with XRE-family HTH domain